MTHHRAGRAAPRAVRRPGRRGRPDLDDRRRAGRRTGSCCRSCRPRVGGAARAARSSPRWRAGTAPSTGCAGSAGRVAPWPPTRSPSATTCPASYVEFVDQMLSATPFEVVAEFFPSFGALDKFEAVARACPRCRPRSSAAPTTSSPRSATAASCTRGSRAPRLLECEGAGHMVILERHDQVNADPRPADRRGRGAGRPAAVTRRRTPGRTGVRGRRCWPSSARAFEARPPLDPPAAALSETEESMAELARHARRACWPRSTASPVGALVLDPVGTHDVPAPVRRRARGAGPRHRRRC